MENSSKIIIRKLFLHDFKGTFCVSLLKLLDNSCVLCGFGLRTG